jgi:phenylalanine-4-hydroxylase
MKQRFENYTPLDASVWRTLFERQSANLHTKASVEYVQALQEMAPVLNSDSLPHFEHIREWFAAGTAWEIACVKGLIPVEEFFLLLAEKRFPSSTWLRTMEQLDYLEEPDMFHDIFGHVPLLSNPVFSDFMQAFGALGVLVLDQPERVLQLQRLYWFTIEFGLIRKEGLKVYGAGIASSFGETNYALSGTVTLRAFNPEVIIQTPFYTDRIQNQYFVIQSFEELFDALVFLQKKWTCRAVV